MWPLEAGAAPVKGARGYQPFLNRIRAEVGAERVTDLPVGDHVQPTVQLEDASHLVVPHTVPVAYAGAFVGAVLTFRSGGFVRAIGAPILILSISHRSPSDASIGITSAADAAILGNSDSGATAPELVSRGPITAEYHFGSGDFDAHNNNGGYLIPGGDNHTQLGLLLFPGEAFYYCTANNNLELWHGIAWQEYPSQLVMPGE